MVLVKPVALWPLQNIAMTEAEYANALNELDRVLNDPTVPLDPTKVWELLSDLMRRNAASNPARNRPLQPC